MDNGERIALKSTNKNIIQSDHVNVVLWYWLQYMKYYNCLMNKICYIHVDVYIISCMSRRMTWQYWEYSNNILYENEIRKHEQEQFHSLNEKTNNKKIQFKIKKYSKAK